MPSLSRVVWSEGMHLAQHHFQMQNRYFEAATTFAFAHLFFRPYGLVACELDAEAVRNGTAALVHARGVMPDGMSFHFPEDPLPEPLRIAEHFSPTDTDRLLCLAIPGYREGKPNCRLNGDAGPPTRFVSWTATIADETTGADQNAVGLARKNFRLVLAESDSDAHEIRLPLARVRRDGAGRFAYDEEYIPPSLQIGASERLMGLLLRLVETLDTKADLLAAERGGAGDGSAYAADELARFWLSHTVHSTVTPLRHHLEVRRAHPEQVYLELARLAGALCTFSMDAHPRDLPLYDHDAPSECFGALERRIRAHLERNLPTGAIEVPLESDADGFHRGAIVDSRALGKATWFLGVRSTLPRAELASRVEGLVKLCSEKFVAELVRRGMDGLPLEHQATPPAEISPRVGTEYFRVVTNGPCWDSIVDTTAVGVHVPAAIPSPQLELRILTG